MGRVMSRMLSSSRTARRMSRWGSAFIDNATLGFVFEVCEEVTRTEEYNLVCFPGKGHV